MNVHYFQHVPFEGLGEIEPWLQKQGFKITATRFYEEHASIPRLENIDALVIMGGPMSVYDDHKYPWLHAEKIFIEEAIRAGKKILGICLGAQLIALCMGALVSTAREREIGWYRVSPTVYAKHVPWFEALFKSSPIVFHWHGDKFETPYGAVDLLSSEANGQQAFLYGNQVLALQFHLEVNSDSVKDMIANGRSELLESAFIQSETTILEQQGLMEQNHQLMALLLRHFFA